MSTQWYYQRDGEAMGPFSRDELKYLASRGEISPHDQVRRGETGHWAPITTLSGFFTQPAVESLQEAALEEAANDDSEDGEFRPDANEENRPPERKRKKKRVYGLPLLMGSGCGCLTAALLLLLLMLFLLPLRSCQNITPGLQGDVVARRSGVTSSNETALFESRTDGSGQPHDASSQDTTPNGANSAAAASENSQQEQKNNADNQEDAAAAERRNRDLPEDADSLETEKLEGNLDEEEKSSSGLLRFKRAPAANMPEKFDLPDLENMFAGRTAARRADLALKEGTPESEAAVKAGLAWLVQHQNPAGSWSLDNFQRVNNCACGDSGLNSDAAGTALALLPFLGAGHTHRQGDHQRVVKRALDWLVKNQTPSGSFASIGGGNMYAHGQASLALAEALAMTGDRKLKKPAQRAIDFIVAAQHTEGGWRYAPRSPGDLSVVGWQIMALRSADLADLNVPVETMEAATRFIDSVQADKIGGRYAYMRGSGARLTMTAEGLLCRQYTGWPKIHPGMASGVEHLAKNLAQIRNPNMYYWYYATQVMHHYQGDPWEAWNAPMRDTLIALQETQGHQAGSWTPRDIHDSMGGRVYMTALAICTLEVYYRHAPLYAD